MSKKSPRSLAELAVVIDRHRDWWRFPAEPGVRGFMGDEGIFFVGDQPSTSAWPSRDPGRRIFYDGLSAVGLGNAHLTDLVKRRGRSSELKRRLPLDFDQHIAFFREELELLQPQRVVAVGRLCERLLDEHVPEVRPLLSYVHHFAYAARPHVSIDYQQLLADAAAGREVRPSQVAQPPRLHAPMGEAADRDSLVRTVDTVPPGIRPLRWTLRRDNNGHYHGVVKSSGSSVFLQLSWRSHKGATANHAGIYRLNIKPLLDAGCIRYEPDSAVGNRFRVRVVMWPDDTFALQVRAGSPHCRLT